MCWHATSTLLGFAPIHPVAPVASRPGEADATADDDNGNGDAVNDTAGAATATAAAAYGSHLLLPSAQLRGLPAVERLRGCPPIVTVSTAAKKKKIRIRIRIELAASRQNVLQAGVT